ncbi:MAG: hypothetical protein KAU23_00250, partial [Anaerolineales bacterium]|nr:hypothetical protein [Anaerolineales bacterium]
MWSDWGFWQYCVAPAGTVPGIHTPIDMNIFNGVEEGLSEFDAASPLWVSLTNYTTAAPSPHYADITADVNGDAVGTINYAFWWDCTSLEVDITTVSASCGTLPTPAEGECLGNEYGVRCNAVAEEVKMVEHTYQEVGDYTAKVVVEREAAPPAEDRYHITVYNPILSITPDPISPGESILNQLFQMSVEVEVDTSLSGALQVELFENGQEVAIDQGCQTVGQDVRITKTYDFSFSESEFGLKNYTIWARYQPGQECPILNPSGDDQSEPYSINWGAGTLADFNGDGDTDLSVYKPEPWGGTWYIKDQEMVSWGNSQSIPVPSDYDGDGVTDIAVYNEGTWYIKDQLIDTWGDANSIPVQGDYNGDGVTDLAVIKVEPWGRTWYIKDQATIVWGSSESIPVPSDYDGDGDVDPAVYINGTWYIKDQFVDNWGDALSYPLPAPDTNGDGDPYQ